MTQLSVCCIALDEEQLLGDMLASAGDVADELVVGVDCRTTDRSAAIALEHGARVVPIIWADSFAGALNSVIAEATGDWILRLDADERLVAGGATAVRDVISCGDAYGPDLASAIALEVLEMDTAGNILNHRLGPGRLFRRLPFLRYVGRVHEEIVDQRDPLRTTICAITGAVGVIHVGFDPAIAQQRAKLARNRRLLDLQLADDADDWRAHFHLARQDAAEGRAAQAAEHARRALVGDSCLPSESRALMWQLVGRVAA